MILCLFLGYNLLLQTMFCMLLYVRDLYLDCNFLYGEFHLKNKFIYLSSCLPYHKSGLVKATFSHISFLKFVAIYSFASTYEFEGLQAGSAHSYPNKSFLKKVSVIVIGYYFLSQGVVVLSRQWKNALYMPLLMEQTFRNKQARPTFNYRSVYSFCCVVSIFYSHKL